MLSISNQSRKLTSELMNVMSQYQKACSQIIHSHEILSQQSIVALFQTSLTLEKQIHSVWQINNEEAKNNKKQHFNNELYSNSEKTVKKQHNKYEKDRKNIINSQSQILESKLWKRVSQIKKNVSSYSDFCKKWQQNDQLQRQCLDYLQAVGSKLMIIQKVQKEQENNFYQKHIQQNEDQTAVGYNKTEKKSRSNIFQGFSNSIPIQDVSYNCHHFQALNAPCKQKRIKKTIHELQFQDEKEKPRAEWMKLSKHINKENENQIQKLESQPIDQSHTFN